MTAHIEPGPIIDGWCAFRLEHEIGGEYRLGHDERDAHGASKRKDRLHKPQYAHDTGRHWPEHRRLEVALMNRDSLYSRWNSSTTATKEGSDVGGGARAEKER